MGRWIYASKWVRLMRGLHQVAVCFPAVKTIRADLLAPGESRHDEYGNAVAGPEASIVSLSITADDLRAFKQNFEWESYPVYAANRYVRSVSLNFTDVWHRELEKEEEIGDFVNSLLSGAPMLIQSRSACACATTSRR